MKKSNLLFGTASGAVAASLVLTTVLSACGGAPVQKVEIEEPKFKVLDAAPGGREAWLDNPSLYAEKEGLDIKNNFYFTGEAKSADKRMACENAYADATDDLAKQVSAFVNTSIARASSDSTAQDSSGVSSVSASQTETARLSSQLSKVLVTGLNKKKQYWEQRDYSEVQGAKSIYHCWVLTEVSQKKVEQLILKAEQIRFKNDPNLKQKV